MTSGEQPPISVYWMEDYLVVAVERDLCMKVYCTTCGAIKFRTGLRTLAANATGQSPTAEINSQVALVLGTQLALLVPGRLAPHRLKEAVRFVLCEVWDAVGARTGERTLAPKLAGTWSGSVLESMQAHDREKTEAHKRHEVASNPELGRQRREENRRLRQERHAERLVLKKERDRLWREKHPGGDS